MGDSGVPFVAKARSLLEEVRLTLRNLLSRRLVTAEGGPVVSLTSYGLRLRRVFLTIESIGRGRVKPGRLVLWVSDDDVLADPPRALRRLVRRGLELRPTVDHGPHKKYFPLVMSEEDSLDVIVTADDDVYYHPRWLESLVAAHELHPSDVIAVRARQIGFDGGTITPYNSWALASVGAASLRVFPTGVGGVLYPQAVIREIRAAGDGFLAVAPRADDVWLHMLTLRAGSRARRIASPSPHELVPVRGSGGQGLWEENVRFAGNDPQISSTYPPTLIERILDEKS